MYFTISRLSARLRQLNYELKRTKKCLIYSIELYKNMICDVFIWLSFRHRWSTRRKAHVGVHHMVVCTNYIKSVITNYALQIEDCELKIKIW